MPASWAQWLRGHPLAGRFIVRLAIVLPLGLLAGALLLVLAGPLGLPRNGAALGAALVAYIAGSRISERVIARIGIPAPE
jgi:hypothetical protein